MRIVTTCVNGLISAGTFLIQGVGKAFSSAGRLCQKVYNVASSIFSTIHNKIFHAKTSAPSMTSRIVAPIASKTVSVPASSVSEVSKTALVEKAPSESSKPESLLNQSDLERSSAESLLLETTSATNNSAKEISSKQVSTEQPIITSLPEVTSTIDEAASKILRTNVSVSDEPSSSSVSQQPELILTQPSTLPSATPSSISEQLAQTHANSVAQSSVSASPSSITAKNMSKLFDLHQEEVSPNSLLAVPHSNSNEKEEDSVHSEHDASDSHLEEDLEEEEQSINESSRQEDSIHSEKDGSGSDLEGDFEEEKSINESSRQEVSEDGSDSNVEEKRLHQSDSEVDREGGDVDIEGDFVHDEKEASGEGQEKNMSGSSTPKLGELDVEEHVDNDGVGSREASEHVEQEITEQELISGTETPPIVMDVPSSVLNRMGQSMLKTISSLAVEMANASAQEKSAFAHTVIAQTQIYRNINKASFSQLTEDNLLVTSLQNITEQAQKHVENIQAGVPSEEEDDRLNTSIRCLDNVLDAGVATAEDLKGQAQPPVIPLIVKKPGRRRKTIAQRTQEEADAFLEKGAARTPQSPARVSQTTVPSTGSKTRGGGFVPSTASKRGRGHK